MGRRQQLQILLKSLMVNDPEADPLTYRGKVYFQPETNIEIEYPCIIYEQDNSRNHFADNIPYSHTKRWQVEVVDEDADSDIPDKVEGLPMCTFQRGFSSAGLYHKFYSLYF